MAGLDCIAMAVAHLEREEQQQEVDDGSQQPQRMNSDNNNNNNISGSNNQEREEQQHRLNSSPVLQGTPIIPQRSTFESAPRRVSSDSAYQNNGDPPMVSEEMPPETITRLVDSLSKNEGDPPKVPDPSEVFVNVKESDVLMGRGGESNHHHGNIQYRNLVKKYQPLYIMSKRRDKPRIAEKIVRDVRRLGGRFLRKDKANSWRDVGNTKAREKTSQALREGAPEMRVPAKDKEAEEQPTQGTPSPTQTLGTRSYEEHSSAGSPVSMSSGPPRVVETHPGEMDRFDSTFQPSPKRMRLPGNMEAAAAAVHGLTQLFGGSIQGFTQQGPPFSYHLSPEVASYGSSSNPQLVSPGSFAAAVSADSDEGRVPAAPVKEEEAPKPAPRGPRLKLLKKRLQAEVSDGN